MDKIYFLANWGKNKESAWSGTYWGLYTALNKLITIDEIDLKTHRISPRKILHKILMSNDMNLSIINNYRKQTLPILKRKDKNVPILQFDEIVFNSDQLSTYIYQDLSASYVEFLSKTDSRIFQYSGFSMNSKSAMHKRCNIQMQYYQTCSGIFTMGKWLKADLTERCGISSTKVHHVGGGINLDKDLIHPAGRTNNKILFVGRDFQRKGGFLVYKAFKKLKQRIPNLELYVAGPSINPIQNPIDGYYYMGDCSHKTLSVLFNKCDVFCMPSYFEAYGLVFIEALAYGLPCIGRNAYEMPYFIENGETGLLLEKDDADTLSTLIEELLNNDQIKQNVLNKKEYYLQEYSWDTVAGRISKIINNTY